MNPDPKIHKAEKYINGQPLVNGKMKLQQFELNPNYSKQIL